MQTTELRGGRRHEGAPVDLSTLQPRQAEGVFRDQGRGLRGGDQKSAADGPDPRQLWAIQDNV